MPLGNPTVLPIQPFTPYGLDYAQEITDFVADAAMPFFLTNKTSGWYYVPDARNFLRAEDVTWSRETGATRVLSQYGKDTFIAQPYGAEEPVSNQDASDWMGGPADLGTQTMRGLLQRLAVAREVRTFGIVDGSGAGTTSVSGVGQWDSTAANPRLDVVKAQAAVHKRIGRVANNVIISGLVYETVVGSQAAGTAGAAILDAIKYTAGGLGSAFTEDLLARYLNVGNVEFAKSIQSDTTKHTTRTVGAGLPEAGAYIWSAKKVYVFYNGTPGAKEPNFGTSFGTDLATPDDYPELKTKSIVYRIAQTLQEKIVCLPSLNILTTVIS
jgi:hypothetical protein